MDEPAAVRARSWPRLPGSWPIVLLAIGLILAVTGPLVTVSFFTEDLIWPYVVDGFTATYLAFLGALAWDRHQRVLDDHKEAAAEERRAQAELAAEQERRSIEAKRRFSAIALELERLQASIRRTLAEQHKYKHFFPDLPTGSWTVAGGPLGMIVSNYGLMADLATFYGHVEELRWRLRFKAEAHVDEESLNPIIDSFVAEMADAVEELLVKVRRQIASPDIERIVADDSSVLVSRRQFTGAIRAVDLSALPRIGSSPPA